MTTGTKARILMCPPEHFGVEYVINPWMSSQRGQVRPEVAAKQWAGLRDALGELANIECVAPVRGQPDMVFTANAGLVTNHIFVPSRFRHRERAGEEPLFAAWAKAAGYQLAPLGPGISFEGAGDALYDRQLPILWVGCGFRTDAGAPEALREIVAPGHTVEALRLVDPRFYHLDTCFCPLYGGKLLFYPPAFTAESVQRIETAVPAERRLAVGEADALAFACNAVSLDGAVLMNAVTGGLRAALERWGIRTVITPLGEFMRAGGAAKCLTLRLDDPTPDQ
jgi:N-dimethylarginine dimethylaminohydrolase